MKVLCTICARGGSKGVKNKNSKLLLGKPLIAYSIDQALESNLFDQVVVSTDDENIAFIAKEYGASSWFTRPEELSSDITPKIPVIRHALLESETYFDQTFDVIVDLDATSPLRNKSDILESYKKFKNDKSDILITGTPSRKNPYFNMVELINSTPRLIKKISQNTVTRRQDAPRTYDMNASIYIWRRQALIDKDTVFTEKTSLYVMPEERSIDIDTETDWAYVEWLMSHERS